MASDFRRDADLLAELIQLHLDLVADDAHRIGLEVLGAGRRGRLAGLHIKATGMQRAFDLALVEPPVGQLGVSVGADVVGGVERAVELVKRDLLAADHDAEHIALAEIAAAGGVDPPRVVAHRPGPFLPVMAELGPAIHQNELVDPRDDAGYHASETRLKGVRRVNVKTMIRRQRLPSARAPERPGDHRQSRPPAAPDAAPAADAAAALAAGAETP